MNIDGLSRHKNIGYTVIIIVFIAGMFLFSPTIFPQAGPGERDVDPEDPELSISGLAHSPSSPTPANDVDVSFTCVGATYANLYYTYTGNPTGEDLRVSMTDLPSDKWSGQIPRQADGISVTYWVQAGKTGMSTSSSLRSYTSRTPQETPQQYDATFVIYKEVDGAWELVPLYGELSGRIRIELTVIEGAAYVTRAVIRFFCLVDDAWTEQEEIAMVSTTGTTDEYWTTYDTTKLANNLYDVRYELFDVNGASLFTESLFSAGDGLEEGIDPDIIRLGLVGVVVAAVLIVLLKKRRK